MNTEDAREHMKLIVEAAAEMKLGLRRLYARFELGECTFAEHQRELDEASIAAEEMWRALVTVRDVLVGDEPVGVAPEMPAPIADPFALPAPIRSETVFGGEQRPPSGLFYR